ncbi:MAG: MATE family efflux transporter [Deferribacterota bacterium]|nr:MATE family efflux transporter [Deferribacterota bacterium]
MIYTILNKIRYRYISKGGYGEFLALATPLILTTSSWSIQHFVDRMFLSWYSPVTIAAAMPAGAMNFTFLSLFLGTVTYTGTFIAQYYGAKQYDNIGSILWQGIYLALIGAALIGSLTFFSSKIFNLVGHAGEIKVNEIIYFNILCLGAFPMLLSACISSFFSSIGKTWIVMWVNFIVTAINILFDYLLIFGISLFPEAGIKGAAIATVIASIFNVLTYVIIINMKNYNKTYNITSNSSFKIYLFSKLIKFGFPAGVQFFLDMVGFSIFVLFVGKLGVVELAATSIAFNVSTLVFLPMIGSGIAASVLVGQYLGRGIPTLAEKSIYSAFHLVFVYMLIVVLLYLFTPDIFIKPFIKGEFTENYVAIYNLAIILLRFVALYSIFDTFNIIFAAALKGAGDTKYVMKIITILSFFVLIVPTYFAVEFFNQDIYILWCIFSIYITLLGLFFYFRFKGGKWRSMLLIEDKKIFNHV